MKRTPLLEAARQALRNDTDKNAVKKLLDGVNLTAQEQLGGS